jgi:hypothetical protein
MNALEKLPNDPSLPLIPALNKRGFQASVHIKSKTDFSKRSIKKQKHKMFLIFRNYQIQKRCKNFFLKKEAELHHMLWD